MMYAKVNTDRAIQDLPARMFSDYENELLDVIRGKSGDLVMSSAKSTKTSTDFKFRTTSTVKERMLERTSWI